jgi:hypothetical protein
VPILSEWLYDIVAFRGTTQTIVIHFDAPHRVNVQVAVGACGGTRPYVEVGLSGFAQNFGAFQRLGSDLGASLPRVISLERVTDLWLTARADRDSWVAGSARILEWG